MGRYLFTSNLNANWKGESNKTVTFNPAYVNTVSELLPSWRPWHYNFRGKMRKWKNLNNISLHILPPPLPPLRPYREEIRKSVASVR